MEKVDVAVIGGGPAGLSAAIVLARSRRRVVVFDDETPRNAPSAGVHNMLSREGVTPQQLLGIGREEARSFGADLRDDTVVSITTIDGQTPHFRIEAARTQGVEARRVLVATGVRDELPEIDGIDARWGRDVLHCPYCHGWEVRDRKLVVLGTPLGIPPVLVWRQQCDDVTLVLHDIDELDQKTRTLLAASGVHTVPGRAVAVVVKDDAVTGVRLDSGIVVDADVVGAAPRVHSRVDPLGPLGLEAEPLVFNGVHVGDHLAVAQPPAQSSVPGVWVAGNVTDPMAKVVVAAAAGTTAGIAINAELVMEESRALAAVAKHPATT